MEWTAAMIGEAVGAEVSSSLAPVAVREFSIDSRTLRPGQCFVAIEGPNFDGHDFVQQALARGASACIVNAERCPGLAGPESSIEASKLIAVPETLAALQSLARFARRQWGKPVIGVTGSVGKTTTKDMIAAVLAAKFRVLKSEGNLNNEYGLPLSLLRLEDRHELAVLEMGMAHGGEIAKLCRVAEPNVGVVTAVAPVHLEFFGSVEEIATAKRELIEGLSQPATAVLNGDDDRVAGFADGFTGKVVRFGFADSSHVSAERIEDNGLAGTRFDLLIVGQRESVTLSLPGRPHVHNALAACAVAGLYGVEPAEMREALATFRPAALRGERLEFDAGFTVVNDAYNSNPVALQAMAEALSRTPQARRRVLVAGEMKELGSSSPQLHEEAGAAIAALGNIDFLAGVTGDARHLVAGAVKAGLPEDRALFFEEKDAAAAWLCGAAQPGDWILLKASRGVALEELLEALRTRFPAAIPAGQGVE